MRFRAALVGLCLVAADPSFAQPSTATLTGVVQDQAGGTIPGASVTAVFEGRADRRVRHTDPQGVYNVNGLAPGRYTITIEYAGFTPLIHRGITLYAGETTRLDAELQVASVSVEVHIVDAPPLLRTETAALGHVVDAAQILSLPLNGRSFIALAALAPGVALPPGSAFPRINGGRPRTNEYLFDGISVLQPEPGQVAFLPVVDAIEAFTIESNSPSAEFGRFNGGVINLTTRSGTNSLSGAVFGFMRHESLNARNYFAPAGAATPLFRRVQAGGVAGGPLRRDRTFFFIDYQGQRQKIGRTVISTVPSLLQRQGIFTEMVAGRAPVIYDPISQTPFPDNTIPVARFDPIADSLTSRYPLPTSPGTANNYRRTADETTNQNQFDVRLDQRLGARGDYAFARMSSFRDRVIPVTPLPDGSGAVSGTPGPQTTRAYALATSYNAVLSATLINELRFGDTRRSVDRRAARHDGRIVPAYTIAGYQQLGSPPNTETDFNTGVLQLTNAFSWVRNRHVVKAGFDVRWSRLDVVQPPSPAGLYQFSSVFTDLPGSADTGAPFASFLLGQVQGFSIDVQSQQIRNRAHTQEYFVQDAWRATSRVTVNGGVRYTLNFPSHEQNDQAAVFNLDTQELEYLGRNGHPRAARRLHTNNFGPRVGIAGRINDHTVVRAGYAVVWIEQAGITTPFTTPSFPFLQTVTQRTLDNVTPAFVLANGPGPISGVPPTATAGLGQGVFAVDRELGSGYVQQWNVSSQRELWSGAALEIAYVGSKITRVGIPDTNLNQLTVEQLALGPVLLERVPNPYFGVIPVSSTLGEPTITRAQLMKPYPQYATVSLYRNNVGNTNYHGVTAKLEQRMSRGLSYSIAYTRSRLMDDASSVFDASVLTGPVASYPVADSFNRRLERDYSTGDIPHVLVAHTLWEIPRSGGVTLSAIATLQSGAPLAVSQATNFNAFAGFGMQRPNVNGNPTRSSRDRTPERWFNTGMFSVAPQFTLGNSSRNPVRGPGYRNVDLAIARRTRIGGRASVETRVEIFNLSNTPALGAPNMVVGSPAFGSITSAGDPRVVQLALKLMF
jgi:hypothetical protein